MTAHYDYTPNSFYKQSAVIPYRKTKGGIEILIITSRSRKRWVIPKGVIEPNLTPEDSAAKEAFEEAGVTGKVKKKCIGTYDYKKWGGVCSVKVYPMKVAKELTEWPEDTMRSRKWVSIDEAAATVTENKLKKIIRNLPDQI